MWERTSDLGWLVDHIRIPPFLYGTAWKEEDTLRCVEEAIAAGFRGIDTANQRKHYDEASVGAALQKVYALGQVSRRDLFLQTKFTMRRGQDHRLPYDPRAKLGDQVKQSLESSLVHLNAEYLDSYVLHGPTAIRGLVADDWEIWRAMEELQEQGRVKFLGISNASLDQLLLLWEGAKVKPAFVQNRCFAQNCWDREIRTFCRGRNIIYQAFSLLTANPEVLQEPRFKKIVERVGCTPAQAIFRFALQIGMLPLTGTSKREHMDEDLKSVEFTLSEAEMQTIEELWT